jgi:hypothetical protein
MKNFPDPQHFFVVNNGSPFLHSSQSPASVHLPQFDGQASQVPSVLPFLASEAHAMDPSPCIA